MNHNLEPTSSLEELLRQVESRWAEQKITSGPKLSEAEIATFERQHGVLVPPDFRLYLRTLNGMAQDNESDDNFIGFHAFTPDDLLVFIPPDQWKAIARTGELGIAQSSQFFFCFADWMIDSCELGVLFTSQPQLTTSVFTFRSQPQQIAASFGEFLSCYLEKDGNQIIDYIHGIPPRDRR